MYVCVGGGGGGMLTQMSVGVGGGGGGACLSVGEGDLMCGCMVKGLGSSLSL